QAVEDTADFQQFEMRFIHPNGSQRIILVSQHPVRDQTGTLTAIEGILENITNRKLAEEKLHQSRTSLAIAQRIAHVGNWAINLRTRKTVWSAELYRIFGFDPSQPPPSYAQALRRVHPEDRDRWTEVWRRLITAGTPYEEDFRVVLPGGDLRYIEGRGEGIQDEQGGVVRIFGTGLDITERKRVEAQLRRSEADLAAAQRIAHVGSWSFDASAQRIRWSEETFRIFGLDPNAQEPSYKALAAMVHPDDQKLWDQIVNRSLVEKTSHHHEFRFFRPNGELRYVESRGEVVLNDHSQAVRLFGVVLDITNRKQAEATIQQQEQFLRNIYDGVEAGIFVVDVLGDRGFRYVDSNPAVERMAGAKRENLLNSTPEELLPPETAAKVVNQYQACVDSGSRVTFEEQLLINDQQNWWLTSLNPSRDDQGRIHRIIGTTLNITERKRAEEEIAQKNTDLEAAKQAAEKATRVKGEFLANMSHELRTPLNAILGFAQVMQRTLKQDRDRFQQESAKHLQVIQNSGDHLLQLINDVLDMSKIEAGKVEFNPQPFSFHTLLQSLEEMFQLKAAEKHLDLIFACSLDVPQYIETDEAKLRQILINLLSNAIKFTQTGSVTLGIGGQETLQFKVSDTGCGISPQQLELLFAPFYQTEAGRQSQTGTGLGLAITKTYVELLGGEITVQSALGQGSTFQFTLPVILAEAFEDNIHRPHGSVVRLVPGQPDYRILVVEDKWESRTLLVQLLEPVGFDVREASNGREAIALWEDWHPHLIWMDMRMPVMDGYEATQYIRAHVRGQAPAIIALTASALESDKAMILSAGCDDFVRKPFKDAIIFAKLQQHLGVEYIYAHQIPATIDASESSQPRPLLVPKRLAQLPPEWLAELQDAAGVADAEWIMRLVNKLPDADADIAASLKELLQNFRCDLIEAMASAALGLG
ncbi:MAG: PAS domain-containing protein, partial [Cyanobacteria bacterium J06636_16]